MTPAVPRNPHLPREREDINEVGAHCPVCGAEYRPGFDTCADDGTSLVRGPAPESGPWNTPREDTAPVQGPHGPQVTVATGLPWEDAWLLRGRLESEGIDASVYPPDYASAYGNILGQEFAILVPSGDEADARAVIESLRQP